MPPQPPRKFQDTTIDRCADIASIQRRDIFDRGLTNLVAAACRWHEERQQVASERAEIVRAGRVFASKIAKASPLVRKQLDLAFPDDGATAWLNATLDGIAPSSRGLLSKWNSKMVILLCVLVDKAGGKLTLGDGTTRSQGSLVRLLNELKPYLPRGFVPTSLNTLRRLKKSAACLSPHVR
jgi:hypothetical protein